MSLILVTGAHGFIGRHVARQAAQSGSKVIGLGHGTWPDASRWGLFDWLNGEVDASNLDVLAARHGIPTHIIHLAGGSTVGASLSSPLEDFSRTALTTARLLEWVRTRAPEACVLGASSAAVYGAGHKGSIEEMAAPNPLAPYGTHKLVLEELFRSYAHNFGMRTILVRMFSVYGPGLRKQLLWDLCSRLDTGGRVQLGGTGRERRDWIHVADAARLLLVAAAHADADCPLFNGGTGQALAIEDVAGLVSSAWGGVNIGFSGEVRPGDPESLIADMGKTSEILGFEVSIRPEAGFPEYVRWFRGRGSRD